MKLLIVRHGDPDYSIDSLTPKGWKEAEYLAERLSKLDVKEFYVSPLGRAKDTASCTLKKMNRTAEEKEWLREFAPQIWRPDITDHRILAWDWLPQDWMAEERFFEYDKWYLPERMQEAKVKEEYDWVVNSFDEVLAKNGYRREGHLYRVEKANNDTIVFFCHFGATCVLLSHLLSISPMVLWHGTCSAPTSVTTVVTEERREGIASFRMSAFGDISHLYVKDELPAFAARFCECYANEDERHD
ncbi:MAG: histidine phosphatase family protein [Lachnospiraceae bacterium]|nr:histidine phosphatase family protein [Lachnospiraceae bacterium]